MSGRPKNIQNKMHKTCNDRNLKYEKIENCVENHKSCITLEKQKQSSPFLLVETKRFVSIDLLVSLCEFILQNRVKQRFYKTPRDYSASYVTKRMLPQILIHFIRL